MLYALEFEEDGTLRYHVKNMGTQTVAEWEFKLVQCNASKQEIGSFSGDRGHSWTTFPSALGNLPSGETVYSTDALKEGETGEFSNGKGFTITYFSDAKYAGACLKSYTTEDGKKHGVSGTKLYAELVR